MLDTDYKNTTVQTVFLKTNIEAQIIYSDVHIKLLLPTFTKCWKICFFPNFLQIFSRCYCNSLSFWVPAVIKCLQIRLFHSPPVSKTMQWPWNHPLSHSAQEFSYFFLTSCRYKWELAWPTGSDHFKVSSRKTLLILSLFLSKT